MNIDYMTRITPDILEGLRVTLPVFFVTLVVSIPLGLVIALARLSKPISVGRWNVNLLRKAAEFYIWAMRGTPLLLQILFIFFGLPLMGITLDRMPSVYLAFGLNYSAYFGEIFRSGIQSIERGQLEAAAILGFTPFQINMKIVFPQVFKRTFPAVGNEIISLIKDTSLVYAVGVSDVLKMAKGIANRDATLVPFFVVAAIYLLMTFVITKVFNVVEKKIHYEE